MAQAPADLIERLRPNYADRMLSPVQGQDIQPGLVREWRIFPVRVAVLDDNDLYTDGFYQTVKRSCERWVAATRSVPGGGVKFTYQHGSNPIGAQIVVRFRARQEINGYRGLTLPQEPRWQYIQLAVKDGERWISARTLERLATHELGHALGIAAHSPDAGDVMSLAEDTVDVSRADVNTLRIAYGGRLRDGVRSSKAMAADFTSLSFPGRKLRP
jgi:hypothetical protein